MERNAIPDAMQTAQQAKFLFSLFDFLIGVCVCLCVRVCVYAFTGWEFANFSQKYPSEKKKQNEGGEVGGRTSFQSPPDPNFQEGLHTRVAGLIRLGGSLHYCV
jgi:hypothetical protein